MIGVSVAPPFFGEDVQYPFVHSQLNKARTYNLPPTPNGALAGQIFTSCFPF